MSQRNQSHQLDLDPSPPALPQLPQRPPAGLCPWTQTVDMTAQGSKPMAAGTLKSPFTPRQHDRFGSGLMLLKIGGEGAVVGAVEIGVIPPAECLI